MKASFKIIVYYVLLILIGCKKNNFNTNATDYQTVVQTEITNGDSAFIPIAQTVVVGTGNIIKFSKPINATVSISDSLGNNALINENFSPAFQNNPFAIFTSSYKFKSKNKYTLSVKNGTSPPVTATTYIPAPISLAKMDTCSCNRLNKAFLTVKINFQDDITSDNYYIIEVLKQRVKIKRYFFYRGTKYDLSIPTDSILYNHLKAGNNIYIIKDTIPLKSYVLQDSYTKDLNTDNAKISSLEMPFQRILLTDANFNGLIYHTKIDIDKKLFVEHNLEKQGRILIRLKSVSKELYTYLFDNERYFALFGSIPNSQLITLHSNILNGFGIFGGSYLEQWVFYFEPLN
ncbi:DUF4249 family protein [Parasediminibacterium paludis]|uniref:DUF4249 family protein n=1 Tax=Parasediminibacterium paludis TaxID=908966 RepID=A0ABV8PZ10_9BACT